MENLKPPKPFAFDGSNMAEAWKSWRQAFDFYMVATESDGKSDKIKTSILLTCIGEQGREIYQTFELTGGDNMKLEPVLNKFSSYCNPRSNKTICRHKFFTRKQLEGESFNSFVTELKRLCINCEFGDLKDSLIVDMIIVGVRDSGLKERMLREVDLTIANAEKLGQLSEEAKKNLIAVNEGPEVNRIKSSTDNYTFNRENEKIVKRCKFCSGNHSRGKCPAYGKICRRCKRKNHFEKCCFSKVRSVEGAGSSRMTESSSDDEFVIKSIEVRAGCSELTSDQKTTHRTEVVNEIENAVRRTPKACPWTVTLPTNGENVVYKLDTGAEVNVLPLKVYKSMRLPPKLKKSDIRLSAYNKSTIPVVG